MKILYFEWTSFGNEDIKEAFAKLGHEVIVMPYLKDNVYENTELEKQIIGKLSDEGAEVAFSSNYYVPIANACHEAGVPYISWIYDNPFSMLYSYTIIFETNHIFVFDREQYEEFARNNISTVHYLPLASNPARLSGIVKDRTRAEAFRETALCNTGDIAFVGSMYDEAHTFFRRLKNISEYTRGYLEGVIAAQRQVWGYNFVREVMHEDIMDDMSEDLPIKPGKGSVASREFLFAEYCINREITARERLDYLSEIGRHFSDKEKPIIDLYTKNSKLKITGVNNHGPVDHYETAPLVYNNAKINLNISLRSIHTGIPLRAFEILGSGGFLLTNYQRDFDDCYVSGEDYVSFYSKEDMFEKIEYYLSHDKERREIAENGFRRTMEEHTYERRIKEILSSI